jgi:hypothetical protein
MALHLRFRIGKRISGVEQGVDESFAFSCDIAYS